MKKTNKFSRNSTINILEINPQKYTWNSIFTKYFLALFVVFAIIFFFFLKIIISNALSYNRKDKIREFEANSAKAQYCIEQLLSSIETSFSGLEKIQSLNSILASESEFNDSAFIDAYQGVFSYLGHINVYNPKINSVYVYSGARKYVYVFGSDAFCSAELKNFADKEMAEKFDSNNLEAVYAKRSESNNKRKCFSLIYRINKNDCIAYNIDIKELENSISLPMYVVHNNEIVYSPDNAEFEIYEDLSDKKKGMFYKISLGDGTVGLILKEKTESVYFDKIKYVEYALLVLCCAAVLAFFISNLLYRYITKICSLITNPFSDNVSVNKSAELNYVSDSLKKKLFEKDKAELKLDDTLKQLKSAQSTALQLQISPHFLLNTLNLINSISLAEAKRETKITRIVDLLSGMLYTILDTSKLVCSLEEEISYTKDYISIQKFKYGEFDVIWDIPKEKGNLKIVKFSLQPIIENAIHYGISTTENGVISISGKESENGLYYDISVYNSGNPISCEKAKLVNNGILSDSVPASSIGLWNTNKRLKILLGEKSGIKICPADDGTIVDITVYNAEI